MLELDLKKVTGLCYLTDELIEDTTVLDSFVRMAFAEEFAFVIDDTILRGTGAGQPLGILNSSAKVSVSKESGQAAATIKAQNVLKMFARLPASSVATAGWYINQNTIPQLLQLTLGSGSGETPLYIPGSSLAGRPHGTLLGLPVIVLEQCESIGTEDDIILADFRRYLLASKGGLKVDSSIHVRFI